MVGVFIIKVYSSIVSKVAPFDGSDTDVGYIDENFKSIIK